MNWLPALKENGLNNLAVTPVRHSLANGVRTFAVRIRSVCGSFANVSSQVESTPDAPPPAYSSPSEINTRSSSKPSPHLDVEPKRETGSESPEIKREPEEDATLAQSTINTVKSTAGATYEGLKDQVAHVEAKVSSLTSDATSGLRQRKTGTADPAETGSVPPVKDLAQAVRQGTEGVPIQIVAVLCLLSFLLGYIFF